MEKVYFKPTGILSSYIDRFYVLKNTSNTLFNLPVIPPGTGLELLFHMDDSLSIKNYKLDKIHIICPRKAFEFNKTTHVHYISVRFKCGAFRHFTSIPYTELNDFYLSITDIWGRDGQELLSKLNEVDAITKKILLIEHFLIKRLTQNLIKKNVKWDAIISYLYHNYKTVSLKELSEKTNLSYRQFERNFNCQFGITSKKFQRITRFQDTLKNILLHGKPCYLEVALDNGYFDQSHFIHEFQYFIEKKPTAYFTSDNFDSHLYFSSINS